MYKNQTHETQNVHASDLIISNKNIFLNVLY